MCRESLSVGLTQVGMARSSKAPSQCSGSVVTRGFESRSDVFLLQTVLVELGAIRGITSRTFAVL